MRTCFGVNWLVYNKIIIKRYSRSLCKTLEVFACAGAKQVRASDFLDPAVSGPSKGVGKVAGQVARCRRAAKAMVADG